MSGKNLEKGNTTTQSISENTQHIAAQGNVIRNDCGSVTQNTIVIKIISESDLLKYSYQKSVIQLTPSLDEKCPYFEVPLGILNKYRICEQTRQEVCKL
jgi:hypothetical protein